MTRTFTERDMENAFEAGEVNRTPEGFQKLSSSAWVANYEATSSDIEDQIKKIFNEYATGLHWLEISADDLDEFAKRIVDEIITQ